MYHISDMGRIWDTFVLCPIVRAHRVGASAAKRARSGGLCVKRHVHRDQSRFHWKRGGLPVDPPDPRGHAVTRKPVMLALDNDSYHRARDVRELAESLKIELLYLPPTRQI